MARRKKVAAHENHERWLVSYADFITLLFAFFVVMFASSQTDKSRAKQISQAVEKALADGKSLAWLHAHGKVVEQVVEDDYIHVTAFLSPDNIRRFESMLC